MPKAKLSPTVQVLDFGLKFTLSTSLVRRALFERISSRSVIDFINPPLQTPHPEPNCIPDPSSLISHLSSLIPDP
jgi:hypothetical protein